VTPLVADGRRLAVARKHDRVVGERVEPAANARCQGCKVAIREVGAADSLLKQDIPAKHQMRARVVGAKDDMSARVAGDRDDREGEACELEAFAVVEDAVRRRAHQGQAERGGEVAGRIGQLRGVVAADQDRERWPLVAERGVAGNVVGMPVGEEDRDRGEAAFLDPLDDGVWFEARIDDQSFHAAAPAQHVGVFTERRRLDASHHDVGLGWQQFDGRHGNRASEGGCG